MSHSAKNRVRSSVQFKSSKKSYPAHVIWNPSNPQPYFNRYGADIYQRAYRMNKENRQVKEFTGWSGRVQSQRLNDVFYTTTQKSCNCPAFEKANANNANISVSPIQCKHMVYMMEYK